MADDGKAGNIDDGNVTNINEATWTTNSGRVVMKPKRLHEQLDQIEYLKRSQKKEKKKKKPVKPKVDKPTPASLAAVPTPESLATSPTPSDDVRIYVTKKRRPKVKLPKPPPPPPPREKKKPQFLGEISIDLPTIPEESSEPISLTSASRPAITETQRPESSSSLDSSSNLEGEDDPGRGRRQGCIESEGSSGNKTKQGHPEGEGSSGSRTKRRRPESERSDGHNKDQEERTPMPKKLKAHQNKGRYSNKSFGTGLERDGHKTRYGFQRYKQMDGTDMLTTVTRVTNISWTHRGITVECEIAGSPITQPVEHFDLWQFDDGPEKLHSYLLKNRHLKRVFAFNRNPNCALFRDALFAYARGDPDTKKAVARLKQEHEESIEEEPVGEDSTADSERLVINETNDTIEMAADDGGDKDSTLIDNSSFMSSPAA